MLSLICQQMWAAGISPMLTWFATKIKQIQGYFPFTWLFSDLMHFLIYGDFLSMAPVLGTCEQMGVCCCHPECYEMM